MKKPFIGILCLGLCKAGALSAEPCVGKDFDIPLPNANDVVTRYVDVPSPKFPGLWQEGVLNGNFYVLYANAEGVVRSAKTGSSWEIAIQCDVETKDCISTTIGEPPESAQKASALLERCIQGQDLSPPPSPKVVVLKPCGIATIPEGTDGLTLQRLLVAAGQDPGPIDGLPGRKTRDAVVKALGENAVELSTTETIKALDSIICNRQE